MSAAHAGQRRLLIRDLEQVVTPASGQSPLRGSALGEVAVVGRAFVLCADGRIEAVGRMQDLRAIDGEIAEVDGRGLCAIPGLVDCHTHPAFGGDRVEEFALRSGGATYEELHAAGGGILSTVRATRDAGRDGLADAVRLHREWMLRAGTTTFEGKSGYGLDRDTELASLTAIAEAGGVPTFLGAHAVPPEFGAEEEYVDFLLADVLPDAAVIAEAADIFVEASAFDLKQARRYLLACRDAGLSLRLHADQFTELGGIELALELGAASVDHLEATGPDGVEALAAGDVIAVLLPASALFLGRPMPPARDLVDAGAPIALATDFNPGSAFCESLPLVCSLACTQLRLSPAEALSACTVNAAAVLGRAERKGRLEPGYDADVVLLDAPDWRYLAYHLGGDVVAAVIRAGEPVWQRLADRMPSRKLRRRRQKERRHEWEEVWVDDDGNEVEAPPPEDGAGRPERRATAARPPRQAGGRTIQPPSWRRVGKRALIFAPLMFLTVSFLSSELSLTQRVLQTFLLLAFFLPFSYFMDSLMYRMFLRRSGGAVGRKT